MTVPYSLLGAASVFFGAWSARRALCHGEDATGAQIRGYLTLLETIRHGIAYDRAPLCEILDGCPRPLLSACAGHPVTHAEDLEALAQETHFHSAALAAVVGEAAARLGRGYREEQVKACDRYVAEIAALAEAHEKRRRERNGTVSTLLYAAAAAAVLLLL